MGHSCSTENKQPNEIEIQIQETLSHVKNIVLIMSGKGGVGKSTVAVNLSVGLAQRGNKVGLLDVDLHGPSVPGLLGLTMAKPESSEHKIVPIPYMENLSVLSIGNLLPDKDNAVIWRGPMKISAIRQFVADAKWGELDYLIIDAPPGTGDEPLTVAQDFKGVRAVVVTTPQEISLADVRKSINFCHSVAMPVVGVIENMSGYICPDCGHTDDLFGSGGGEKTAKNMGVPFLGKIPIDGKMVASGDLGKPYMMDNTDTPVALSYASILDAVEIYFANRGEKAAGDEKADILDKVIAKSDDGCFKIAVPTAKGITCGHFGQCEKFSILTVKDCKIIDKAELTPPGTGHEAISPWLAELGVKVVLAGGMGLKAQDFLNQNGVEVTVGVPSIAPEAVVQQFLDGTLGV